MIITVSGLDGAGKSTQTDKLIQRLEQEGFKTRYVWARGGYTPGFEMFKRSLRFIFLHRATRMLEIEVLNSRLSNEYGCLRPLLISLSYGGYMSEFVVSSMSLLFATVILMILFLILEKTFLHLMLRRA